MGCVLSPGDVDVCEAAVELAGCLKESLLPHRTPFDFPVLASVQKVGQAQGRHTLCNHAGDPRFKFNINRKLPDTSKIPIIFSNPTTISSKSKFLRSKHREQEISCTTLKYNFKSQLEKEVFKSLKILLQIHFNANFFSSKQQVQGISCTALPYNVKSHLGKNSPKVSEFYSKFMSNKNVFLIVTIFKIFIHFYIFPEDLLPTHGAELVQLEPAHEERQRVDLEGVRVEPDGEGEADIPGLQVRHLAAQVQDLVGPTPGGRPVRRGHQRAQLRVVQLAAAVVAGGRVTTAGGRCLVLPLDGDVADGRVGRHNLLPDVGAQEAAAVCRCDKEAAEAARLRGAGGVELGEVGGEMMLQYSTRLLRLSIF
jgi:hypothetical protein